MDEQTLTLYYYNDGLTKAERQAVAGALATDPAVAERYRKLCRDIEHIVDPDFEAPPADMQQRWHDGLDRAAGVERQAERAPVVHSWSFLLGVGVTAALAVGIGIGVVLSGGDLEVPQPAAPSIASGGEPATASSAFMRGLEVHLRNSEQGLAALATGVDPGRTALIMDIVAQNRRFERAAVQNDADSLARVLRAFELVLIRLAAEDIAPQEADALREKLLFELNIVLTKLSRTPSDEPQSI